VNEVVNAPADFAGQTFHAANVTWKATSTTSLVQRRY
jgi:hypothetical protein